MGWGTRPVTFLTPQLLFLLELTDVTLADEEGSSILVDVLQYWYAPIMAEILSRF